MPSKARTNVHLKITWCRLPVLAGVEVRHIPEGGLLSFSKHDFGSFSKHDIGSVACASARDVEAMKEEAGRHLLLSLVFRLAAFFSFPPRLYLFERDMRSETKRHRVLMHRCTHLASFACLLKPFCGKSEPRAPLPLPLPSSLLPPRPAAAPLLGPSLSTSKVPSVRSNHV